jgi:hypothetical protein
MPTSILLHSIESWIRIHADYEAEGLEIAKFEHGSNFKYESAILLRVLHTKMPGIVRSCPSGGIETLWIKGLELSSTARQTEAKEAIRGSQFEELLQILERSGTGAVWASNGIAMVGASAHFYLL